MGGDFIDDCKSVNIDAVVILIIVLMAIISIGDSSIFGNGVYSTLVIIQILLLITVFILIIISLCFFGTRSYNSNNSIIFGVFILLVFILFISFYSYNKIVKL